MFGIGLPELILIMAVALIVVGPEKLPDLARGLAKQFFELKKAASVLKDSLQEEESLSSKTSVNQDSPVGFSRPEQLAAAALAGQSRVPVEPGSPRQEVLELVDEAPRSESAEIEAEVAEVVSQDSQPMSIGDKPGKADV